MKSSHWITGPNAMSDTAMGYFNTTDKSQEVILKLLLSRCAFKSAVDFGTGRGSWLKTSLQLGIEDIRGYDIPEIDIKDRQFPPENFVPADLAEIIAIERKFDLAISTEVAEHIPYSGTSNFIKNISNASDLVLFSAALPYQGGAGHHNESWVEYWADYFHDEGYSAFDFIRPSIWHDASVRSYYRQNILVFARNEKRTELLNSGAATTEKPLSLVHPEQFIKVANRRLKEPEVGRDVSFYYDCVTKKAKDLDQKKRHTYG